jgi:hypothetical protein
LQNHLSDLLPKLLLVLSSDKSEKREPMLR